MTLTPTESVLVCSLPKPDLATRRSEINEFIRNAISVNATPDGVVFVFENTADAAHALMDFILFEQQCCSNVSYELRSEPRHTKLTLQLYAPKNQVNALHAIYVDKGSQNSSRPARPSGAADRFIGQLEIICGAAAPFGAFICAIICLGVPVVSVTLGMAGAGFLRNDRPLIPSELLCCAMLVWSLVKSRRAHGKAVALWLGLFAVGPFLSSMFISGTASKIKCWDRVRCFIGFFNTQSTLLTGVYRSRQRNKREQGRATHPRGG